MAFLDTNIALPTDDFDSVSSLFNLAVTSLYSIIQARDDLVVKFGQASHRTMQFSRYTVIIVSVLAVFAFLNEGHKLLKVLVACNVSPSCLKCDDMLIMTIKVNVSVLGTWVYTCKQSVSCRLNIIIYN